MASEDKRHLSRSFPIARYEFATQTFPPTANAALAPTLANLCGTIKAIEILIAETQDSINYGFSLTDENGAVVFSEAVIAHNTQSWRDSESGKAGPDADFNPIPVNGTLTMTITPDNNPDNGNTGVLIATVQVILYIK